MTKLSVQQLVYGLDYRGFEVKFLARARDFCIGHSVESGHEAYLVFYAIGRGFSFGLYWQMRKADQSN
jgi:hypothetical protein